MKLLLFQKYISVFILQEGDNFDANYCNRVDPVDRNTYDYCLQKVNNETYFAKFYYNYFDPKSKELAFELDGVSYKFTNLHEDKEESTSGKKMTSISGTMSDSKRLNDFTNHSQVYNPSFNGTQRKLFN